MIEGDAEDYRAWDGSSTSLVSSRPHIQLEEENPTDESTEDEGRVEKGRDEHFNDIQPMIPAKQKWRVKEKDNTPTPTTSNDDMDLLDDDEPLLIKDGSLPSTSMDINMVFTLSRWRTLICV
jgi:hypothetical protein